MGTLGGQSTAGPGSQGKVPSKASLSCWDVQEFLILPEGSGWVNTRMFRLPSFPPHYIHTLQMHIHGRHIQKKAILLRD